MVDTRGPLPSFESVRLCRISSTRIVPPIKVETLNSFEVSTNSVRPKRRGVTFGPMQKRDTGQPDQKHNDCNIANCRFVDYKCIVDNLTFLYTFLLLPRVVKKLRNATRFNFDANNHQKSVMAELNKNTKKFPFAFPICKTKYRL
jgi:hypothetical protein